AARLRRRWRRRSVARERKRASVVGSAAAGAGTGAVGTCCTISPTCPHHGVRLTALSCADGTARLRARRSDRRPPRTAKGSAVTINSEQRDRIASGQGFIAALDQSGGSTPKALKLYGVDESAYSNDAEMFALVHRMRERIVTSPSFDGRILGAILFERTLDDSFAGQDAARFLWEQKKVVPFLKIDKGLEDEEGGVQMLKPIPGLEDLLARAKAKGVFGTKERSVIKANNA